MKKYLLNYLEFCLLIASVILSIFWVTSPNSNIEPWIVLCISLFTILEVLRQRRKKGAKGMYVSEDGRKILMIQSFADRREWGTTYHCTSPKRVLTKIIKVFGNFYHPIRKDIAEKCISDVVNTMLDLKPDVVGIGGKGNTALQIEENVSIVLPNIQFSHWGKDSGCDACSFLERLGFYLHTSGIIANVCNSIEKLEKMKLNPIQ